MGGAWVFWIKNEEGVVVGTTKCDTLDEQVISVQYSLKDLFTLNVKYKLIWP